VVTHVSPWGGLAQQPIEQLDELDEAFAPLARRPRGLSEHRRIPSGAPGADPEREPAARDVVQRDQLPRKRNGMAEVGRGDERPEADAVRHRGGRRQRRHRSEPRRVTQGSPGQMIVRPRVIEAELLGTTPLHPGIRPRELGQDDDTEAHARSASGPAHASGVEMAIE
jgi:hypothetical protein